MVRYIPSEKLVEKPPAQFFRRFVALLIDIFVLTSFLALGHGFLLTAGYSPIGDRVSPLSLHLWFIVSVNIPVLLYFIVAESSKYHGTAGKLIMKMKVYSYTQYGIIPYQYIYRNIFKFLPFFLYQIASFFFNPAIPENVYYYISLIFAGFVLLGVYTFGCLVSVLGQSLYDKLARTIVVEEGMFH